MKIIVIGMDNTGKTTLCNTLAEKLNYEHVKSPGPQLSKEEMVKWMNEQLSKENVIIERFPFLEEMVYGKILRGKSKFTFRDNINVKDCFIIYCKPYNFTIGNKEEMTGVIENQRILNKQWEKVISKFQYLYGFVYKYNWQAYSGLEELLDAIQFLQELR